MASQKLDEFERILTSTDKFPEDSKELFLEIKKAYKELELSEGLLLESLDRFKVKSEKRIKELNNLISLKTQELQQSEEKIVALKNQKKESSDAVLALHMELDSLLKAQQEESISKEHEQMKSHKDNNVVYIPIEQYKDHFLFLMKSLFNCYEGTKGVVILDIHSGKIVSSLYAEDHGDYSTFIINNVLSFVLLSKYYPLGKLDYIIISGSEGKIFQKQLNDNYLLLVLLEDVVKNFRGFLPEVNSFSIKCTELLEDVKIESGNYISTLTDTIVESINKIRNTIDFNTFKRKINIFFSYAAKDFDRFSIKKISDLLENKDSVIQTRYYHRDISPGEDLIDYMEKGVLWCDCVVWFHSENSEESSAVEKELKMAEYNKKKIITVTDNINSLRPAVKVTWVVMNNPNLDALVTDIYKGIIHLTFDN